MAIPRPKPDGRFRLQLKDGSSVVGKLSVEIPLKLKTKFGDVSIPITKIASLTIDENTKSTKVMCRNGDRLTGQLTTDTLQVKTAWAELAIELKYVQTMVGNDLANGYRMIRRAVIEKTPDGAERVHYIEELEPVGRRPARTLPPGAAAGGYYSTPPTGRAPMRPSYDPRLASAGAYEAPSTPSPSLPSAPSTVSPPAYR